MLERCEGPFLAPQGNLVVGGVRNPDMFGSGARYVRLTSLEAGLGIRYVRFGDLVTEESS
jgi:hypothetical protein